MRRREHRERSCGAKARLASEETARATAMRAIQSGGFRGAKAWVYPCVFCRGWHITSKYAATNRPGAVTATDPCVGAGRGL